MKDIVFSQGLSYKQILYIYSLTTDYVYIYLMFNIR